MRPLSQGYMVVVDRCISKQIDSGPYPHPANQKLRFNLRVYMDL